MLPFSTEFFFILLLVLAVSGFFIVKRLTSSPTDLSEQIKHISSRNLDKHIRGINSKDEIGELAKSFNDLLDRLNQAFKREQQFIADVAHELKTPLATLRSSLEVAISRERSNDEFKKVITEAIKDTNHLSTTLKNILDLAWSETPIEKNNTERINLSELMNELTEISQKMAIQKDINIESQITADIYIIGSKDKLARALMNIIDNAIKYTSAKGTMTLSLKKAHNKASISITDTGQGILEKDIPHIFDRFYRGSATDKVFGSGLGLAITKSSINLHHGDIRVDSKVGQGSTFTITLPLA
jgi:signal transduction histidine kinase